MAHSPLSMTLRHFTWLSGVSAWLWISGCATFTSTSTLDFVADEPVGPNSYSARPKFDDPFRRHSSPIRSHRDLTTGPFAWTTAARTAAGEPLQISSAGDGGFRSLTVGSVGGNDPVAIRLTEDLARYLHDNSVIMGGVDATVLRTLNPDGLKRRQHNNADGVYLNSLFPRSGRELSTAKLQQLPNEVRFLIDQIAEQRPQRIIHIRTVPDPDGMLAVSHGATDSGIEVAKWLGFTVRNLPKDVNPGTLESWATQRGDCDVITIGIPRQTKADNAWELYGDAIVNLLLDGNSESRQAAREQKKRRSANRQNDDSFDYMFRDDAIDAASNPNTPLFD